jgi:MoaA/NifB/PqqE/SkfB family radical SAM enzyme
VFAELDSGGRLPIPVDVAARLGLEPGTPVEIEEGAGGLRLRKPVTHLAKLYIEPTVRCNLSCRTCVRHSWDEPGGDISDTTFAALIAGLQAFDPPPAMFFGGFGEPLAHPGIVDMVHASRESGCTVELITNGVLQTEKMSVQPIGAGLNRMWVSLDGARTGSYADVRPGAALPTVLANVGRFNHCRPVRVSERNRFRGSDGSIST